MATSQQISTALSIAGTFSLIDGSSVITDTTNWGTLGVVSPDTAAFLLFIQDPYGRTFYKNPGYDTANFGSPDFTEFSSNTYSFTLPTDVTGAYITGVYTVNMKVQTNQTGTLTNAAATRTLNVSACCGAVCAKIDPVVTYVPVAVGVTDNTDYGNYVSVANTITLYPPPQSGESSQSGTFTGSPATLYYTPPSGQNPYTGTWSYSLYTVLTSIDVKTQATTTCVVEKQGSFDVVQSPICTVLCFLKEYEHQVSVNRRRNETTAEQMTEQLVQAQGYLAMMEAAMGCGWSITAINKIADKIYELIGADPDCPCQCNSGQSQQIIAATSGSGTPGTNGKSFLQGTGVPSGSLGVVGDSYLDSATDNVYLKTGATTWTFTTNLKGSAGTTAITILYNNFANQATSNTSLQTLDSFTLAAGQFANVSDEVDIEASFLVNTNANDPVHQYVQISLNGVATIPVEIMAAISRVKFYIKLVRINSTTVNYLCTYYLYQTGASPVINPLLSMKWEFDVPLASFTATFANTMPILAQAKSVTTGDLTSEYLSVKYLAS